MEDKLATLHLTPMTLVGAVLLESGRALAESAVKLHVSSAAIGIVVAVDPRLEETGDATLSMHQWT
jgi:hypothetical protein